MRIDSLGLSADLATDTAFSGSEPIKQAFISTCLGESGPLQILQVGGYQGEGGTQTPIREGKNFSNQFCEIR